MLRNKSHNDFVSPQEKIASGLFEKKIHFLYGDIEQENIMQTIKWMIFENNLPDKSPLTLFINSRGGNICDAFALIDIMKTSKKPIITIGVGNVISSAFLIFVSGHKGHRYIAQRTSIMCHQYYDEIGGKHHDLKSTVKELDYVNDRMQQILQDASDQSSSFIKKNILSPSDVYFTANEMVQMGFSDHILSQGDET